MCDDLIQWLLSNLSKFDLRFHLKLLDASMHLSLLLANAIPAFASGFFLNALLQRILKILRMRLLSILWSCGIICKKLSCAFLISIDPHLEALIVVVFHRKAERFPKDLNRIDDFAVDFNFIFFQNFTHVFKQSFLINYSSTLKKIWFTISLAFWYRSLALSETARINASKVFPSSGFNAKKALLMESTTQRETSISNVHGEFAIIIQCTTQFYVSSVTLQAI